MAANTMPVRQNKSTAPSIPRNLRRAVCAEYLRDFDIERVAEMFSTDPMVVRRIVNSKDMVRHMNSSLGDVASLDKIASRRLLEALLEEAMATGDLSSGQLKARTEARKTLARHYLPKKVETKSEHHYFVETPAKLESGDWEKKYGAHRAIASPSPAQTDEDEIIVDAEIIDD